MDRRADEKTGFWLQRWEGVRRGRKRICVKKKVRLFTALPHFLSIRLDQLEVAPGVTWNSV